MGRHTNMDIIAARRHSRKPLGDRVFELSLVVGHCNLVMCGLLRIHRYLLAWKERDGGVRDRRLWRCAGG
jgi:hypothetical protein